jgi:prolyl 4-hydroxylase
MTAPRSARDELLIAEQCDARGDHDSAINALARATRMGDVEATTRLGKRLIVGVDAPLLPQQGAGFLLEAFDRGGAESGAKLAVLAAAGVYMDRNVAESMRLLTTSATRGWAPAQEQLMALSPDRDLAAEAAAAAVAPRDVWQRLADSIDITAWTTAPAGRTLSESPEIRSFAGFLPDPVCAWLIQRSAGRLRRALVYDAAAGADHASETRTNSWAQFDLMGSELIHLLVQLRMQAGCGIPLHNMEANAILHYAPGEEITNHFDFVDPRTPNYEQEIARNGQRVLTFLVYLNDDYEGGETEFPELGIVHRGQRGEGLYFVNALENNEPDLRTVHAGRPPQRGEKWIVSQFVRSRQVLGVAG